MNQLKTYVIAFVIAILLYLPACIAEDEGEFQAVPYQIKKPSAIASSYTLLIIISVLLFLGYLVFAFWTLIDISKKNVGKLWTALAISVFLPLLFMNILIFLYGIFIMVFWWAVKRKKYNRVQKKGFKKKIV